jgi:hypothetical protein
VLFNNNDGGGGGALVMGGLRMLEEERDRTGFELENIDDTMGINSIYCGNNIYIYMA